MIEVHEVVPCEFKCGKTAKFVFDVTMRLSDYCVSCQAYPRSIRTTEDGKRLCPSCGDPLFAKLRTFKKRLCAQCGFDATSRRKMILMDSGTGFERFVATRYIVKCTHAKG